MQSKIYIKISQDFSRFPGARYRSDGPNSGQEFYEDIFKSKFQEAIDQNLVLHLDMDGTSGYASSFISEVFTRLTKDFKDKDFIQKKLEIVSDEDPLLVNQIITTINETDTE
ncbi:MAG: hypothetical protein Fur003_2240 [Candidatus Dojkabacteria bacterium]